MFVPGIDLSPSREHNAESRARESFGEALLETFDSSGYTPAWFSYRSTGDYEGANGQYLASETRQSLDISARALDEQIRDLITMTRDEEPDAAELQIVIVAHSLGGAVTARWAASADEKILAAVRIAFTFDSPLAGVGALRGLFGGDAGVDLQDPGELARFEHGAGRLDFVQVGNTLDQVVLVTESFTLDPWQSRVVTCRESPAGPGHNCSKQLSVDNGFIDEVLNGIPPIWSGAIIRPGPLPEMLEITDLIWTDATGAVITSATRGDVVTLSAKGAEIAGLTVVVRIWEADNFSADDDIDHGKITFSGSDGATTWAAIWMEDEFGGPEYFFSVLGFISPLLTVN